MRGKKGLNSQKGDGKLFFLLYTNHRINRNGNYYRPMFQFFVNPFPFLCSLDQFGDVISTRVHTSATIYRIFSAAIWKISVYLIRFNFQPSEKYISLKHEGYWIMVWIKLLTKISFTHFWKLQRCNYFHHFVEVFFCIRHWTQFHCTQHCTNCSGSSQRKTLHFVLILVFILNFMFFMSNRRHISDWFSYNVSCEYWNCKTRKVPGYEEKNLLENCCFVSSDPIISPVEVMSNDLNTGIAILKDSWVRRELSISLAAPWMTDRAIPIEMSERQRNTKNTFDMILHRWNRVYSKYVISLLAKCLLTNFARWWLNFILE